jgi:hypothetical protein
MFELGGFYFVPLNVLCAGRVPSTVFVAIIGLQACT